MKCQNCGTDAKEENNNELLKYYYCEKPKRLTTYFNMQHKVIINPAEDHPKLCQKCLMEELKLAKLLMDQL